MQVKTGSDRVVFLFPALGIAVKFPIIHFVVAWELLFGGLKKYGWKLIGGVLNLLFRGLADNWMEVWFYVRTRNPFLQPTYFSLFGIFTVQRYGKPCPFRDIDLKHQLEELTDGRAREDGHHFFDSQNFTFSQGALRMIDYGNKRARGVIADYGVRISKRFNPTYEWNRKQSQKLETPT